MTTRDEYWTRDAAADDADRRLEVCPACRAGDHENCEARYGGGADLLDVDPYHGCECDCGD